MSLLLPTWQRFHFTGVFWDCVTSAPGVLLHCGFRRRVTASPLILLFNNTWQTMDTSNSSNNCEQEAIAALQNCGVSYYDIYYIFFYCIF